MSDSGVELKNVTKIFKDPQQRDVVAVDNVSFAVNKGELVTLLGPSGCGKTTILRMIGGFEFCTSGDIAIDGQSMGALPPNRRNTSMVFQSYALFPHMTLYNNVAYGLRLKKLARAEIDKRVRRIFEVVGLTGKEDRSPGQISGGQQQRVALARALVNEPSVLLFDEPLSNLDAKLRVYMREEIRRIQQSLGITSIYVTHDQEEAVAISDRIVLMNNGVIEQIAAPREIYEKPASQFVADFFGKVNFLPAEIKDKQGAKIIVSLFGNTLEMEQEGLAAAAGAKVQAVLRPEAASLSREPDAMAVPAKVSRSVYMGNVFEVTVSAQGCDILVTMNTSDTEKPVAAGDDVFLSMDPQRLHLIAE